MIYLVHFERPYRHARHYLGYTGGSLKARFARHVALAPTRRGSALMRKIMESGIPFKVVRVWPGDRARERQLKGNGHSRRCPVCRGRTDYASARCHLLSEGR